MRASQRIAFGVVGEGIRVLAGILLRLAQREFEMQALVVVQAAMPQLPLHRGDVAARAQREFVVEPVSRSDLQLVVLERPSRLT